jgi:archaellum biogenesis ATPase FlaH
MTEPNGAVTISLADVEPERVDWLWHGRLPLGKIVVLDGDPSVGKSTLAVDCSARVSTGRAWPDGAPNRRAAVLLLSAEDGLADTIRPRLDAAQGNPANVHALTEIRYRDEEDNVRTRPATLADLDEIERAVRRTRAVLVVVDVLMAFLPGKVDSHRDQDVRGVLSGLAAMAERTGCCVLMLRHLNKAAGGSAMYRGGGSIGIIGAARVGLLAALDPEDENRRVLAGIKCNLAAMPEALAYQLTDSPEHGCARVEWLGASMHTAGQLLAGPRDEDERTERDDAADWLHAYLVDNGGEASRRDLVKAARSEGHSERTLQRALRSANVTTARVGFPATTVWRLTDAPDRPQPSERGATGGSGATAEIRGLHSPSDTQSRQSRQPLSAGTTSDDDEPNAPCGHPLKVTNTANGRCALCIVDSMQATTDGAIVEAAS